jgi:hypothetical protein
MPFGIMTTNDMWMFSKISKWIFEFKCTSKFALIYVNISFLHI